MPNPAIRVIDRAKETTTTTGSGTISLGGAVAGFVAISGVGNGNSTYYALEEGNNFEVGIGTYTSVGNTLSRDEVYSSSNSDDSKINLAGGASVFITYPAEKAVVETSGSYVGIGGIDPEYQLVVSGTGSFNTVRWADGTTQTTAATDTTYTAGTGLSLAGTEFNISGIDSTMIVDGSVSNSDLANSSLTVTAGTGLSNGGAVALGASIIIDGDTATTSQVGVVQLQDSATDGTTDKAITPNAVYDISGVLSSDIQSTGESNYNLVRSYVDTSDNATFNNLTAQGNLTVSGTLTYLDSTTVTIADKQLELASNSGTPIGNDSAVNDGGIVVKSTDSDKKWTWLDATDAWTSTENIKLNSGKKIIFGDSTEQTTSPTGDIATVSGLTVTNASNIASTGATNAANIATNTSNISTNTTNIASTGATNAADIDTVSGLLYDYWTLRGDAATTTNVDTTETVQFTGAGTTSVTLGGTDNRTVTIRGAGGGGGGAPTDAQYVTLATDGDLSAERVLAGGTGIGLADGGANGNITVSITGASTSNTGIAYYSSDNFSVSAGYQVSIKDGGVSNDELGGSIANSKLANSSVSYGGVSLSLGGSDATPAFNLSDATGYPTSSLVGTITNSQLAGSIANGKLANDSVTVTAGSGLIHGGEVDLGSSITIDAVAGTTAQSGIVRLQDSATNGTTNRAITPNAVYDISGVLSTSIASTGATNAANIATNTSNISTNTSNISTNTTNIALTGATNATAIATKAPKDSQYVTLALDGDLSAERVLVGGTGVKLTDGGANGNVTVHITGASTSNTGVAYYSPDNFAVSAGHQVTIKDGGVSSDELAGSIANSKLANSSVNYGGVSLSLGGSDTTPAFNLSDATNYPTSALNGTITNAQLAGSIANGKLANDSVTVTAGSGLIHGGEVDLGSSITINAVAGTTAQSGIVRLQDSATNGTTDRAITPNAVYDISGVLSTSIASTGATNAAAIAAKDNYQYWTITDGSNTSNLQTTEDVKITGAGQVTVTLASGNPNVVTVSGAAGGGGVSFGSDNQIPYTNAGGDDFDYSSNLTFNGSQLTVVGDLDVSDEIFVANNIKHKSDTDTYIEFSNDKIRILGGGKALITATEASPDEVIINDGGLDADFRVEGLNDTHLIFCDGSADKVGISNASPQYTIDVSGNARFTSGVSSTGLISAATGVELHVNTPATTTNKLYNVGGVLYFNGSGVNGGGGGGAPTDAQYVTLATDGALSAERVLAGGTGIGLADGGANGNITVSITGASTSNTGIAYYSPDNFAVSAGYQVTIKDGGVSNDELAGSIANSKLANSSVNFGGVSLSLGGSDTTPAFDLSDATAYKTSNLDGTITNAQLAGSIANDKLANSSITVTAGSGLIGGGSVSLGGTVSLNSAETGWFEKIGINDRAPGAMLDIVTSSATTKGLIVQGSASQSENLFEGQHSNGGSLFKIDKDGDVTCQSINATGAQIVMGRAGTSPTLIVAGGGNNLNIRNLNADKDINVDIAESGNFVQIRTRVGTSTTTRVRWEDTGKRHDQAASYADIKENSDASTVTFDLDVTNVHKVTLTADRTFALSNASSGQRFMVRVLQNGTGGHSGTWWSTIKWAGGTPPIQPTAGNTEANKAQLYGFVCVGTNTYDGFVIGTGIA